MATASEPDSARQHRARVAASLNAETAEHAADAPERRATGTPPIGSFSGSGPGALVPTIPVHRGPNN